MIEMGWVLALVRLRERVALRLPSRPPLLELEPLAGLLAFEQVRGRLAARLGRESSPPVCVGMLALAWAAARRRGFA